MKLDLTLTNDEPIYLQIVKHIRQKVAQEELKPGDELPPIRELADQLVVNAHTIARAYRDLANEGVVVKRSTKGTYISEGVNSEAVRRRRLLRLVKTVDSLLAEAKQINVRTEEIIDLVRERDDAHRPGER